MTLGGTFGADGKKTITATFPAAIVMAAGSSSAVSATAAGISNIRAGGIGNSLVVDFPVTFAKSVDASGDIKDSDFVQIDSLSFAQAVPGGGGGSYMGYSGTLSASVSKNLSTDQRMLVVSASFPGQEGFCGGYHSPLMLFFDEKRPEFTGQSLFPIYSQGLRVYWPEAGSAGFFLALDRNGSGKIEDVTELFGNDEKFKDGFEALKALDCNGDSVIDAKDASFSKLLLWRDANGDGVSQKTELVKASSKILSISLKVDENTVNSYGTRAEARQRSTFKFKSGSGIKQGEVIDIWFSPVLN
jgi:hypothetical protein